MVEVDIETEIVEDGIIDPLWLHLLIGVVQIVIQMLSLAWQIFYYGLAAYGSFMAARWLYVQFGIWGIIAPILLTGFGIGIVSWREDRKVNGKEYLPKVFN